MKTKLFLLVFVLSTWMQAQTLSLAWEKSHGGSNYDGGMFVRELTGGGYLTVGTTNSSDGNISTTFGNYDIAVFRLDASGNHLQTYSYGGSSDDLGVRVLYDNNGGYFVIGYTASSDGTATHNRGQYDFWIISAQATGNVLWQEVYGGSNVDVVRDALMTPSGNIVMAGYTRSNDQDVSGNHGNMDGWLVSVNKNTGLINWQLPIGGSQTDRLEAVTQLPSGDFIVVGTTDSSDGDLTSNKGGMDILVAKVSSTGNLMWAENFGGSSEENGYDVTYDASGNIYLTGFTHSSDQDFSGGNNGGSDAFVMKLDGTGNLVWAKTYGGTATETAYGMTWLNNNLVMTGHAESSNGDLTGNYGDKDVWVFAVDTAGALLGQKNFGGSQYDNAHYIITNTAGNLVLTGASGSSDNDVSNNSGNLDRWTVELSSTLEIINPTSWNGRIYPNPATEYLILHSPEPIDQISISDIDGRFIRQYLPGQVKSFRIPVGGLNAGTYILHIRTGKETFTGKFLKN